MKTIFKTKLLQLSLLFLTICVISCKHNSPAKDTTPPVISDASEDTSPTDCQSFSKGSVMPFNYLFTDNIGLGNFNIEVHNNFDHHTHSTSSVDCEEDEEHHHSDAATAWVFNQDYTIPEGLTSYTASFDIMVPDNVSEGSYHFMIRVTDQAGWQQIKSVDIKITD